MPGHPGREERIALPFAEGLYEGLEASALGPGYATELENWVPEANGGLRARAGWTSASVTSSPATRRNTGLGYIASPTPRILSAFETVVGTEVQIYSIDKASLAAGSWTSRDTITVASGASSHVDFALGLGFAYYTSPAFSLIRRWSGTGSGASVTGSPVGARTLAFHKSRLFAGGDSTNPTRLWYSDINDGSVWPAINYIEVGKDDGEPIECLEVFSDQLLIGKENSLWLLTGAGPDTFALHQLGGLGCAPGRTIVKSPYGAIVAGKTYVSVFAGADPQPISEPIEKSYGMTGSYMSAAYIDRNCYVVDQGAAKYWAYDAGRQKWWRESISGTNRVPNNLMTQGNTLFAGPKASTNCALFYRTLPAATRVKDIANSPDDETESFAARTPELWLSGPTAPMVFRGVEVRFRQRGGLAGQEALKIEPTVDGITQDAIFIETRSGAQTFRERRNFGSDGYSLDLRFSQNLQAGQSSVLDIEEIVAIAIPGEPR